MTGPQDWNVKLVPLSWLQGASSVWLMLSAGSDSLGCTLDTPRASQYTYRFRGPYLTKQIRTSGGVCLGHDSILRNQEISGYF